MAGSVRLAQSTSRRAGAPNSLRVGTVVEVSTAGVVVDVGGGEILCGMVGGAGAGVAPGAVVSVFKQADSWQVQGVVVGPGQSTAGTPTIPQPATNTVIIPPALAAESGSQVAVADTVLGAITSASGNTFVNVSVRVLLPAGHLCEVRVAGYQCSATANNFTTVFTMRENASPAGDFYSSYEQVNPNGGNGSHFSFSGYVVGDGAVHLIGLCAQALAAGTVTISRSRRSFIGVIDWGDASGVLQI